MFACIYVPDFPAEAIVRAEPLLRERAVAVLDGKPPVIRVVALNEKARLLGMEVGMTKLQAAVFTNHEEISPAPSDNKQNERGFAHIGMSAQRLMNKLQNTPSVLRLRSAQQEQSAHSAVLDVAHAFTPRVEDTAPDTLLLDLAGLERLYGLPVTMARELASRISAVGLEANIAISANPEAAMHAARGFTGVTVIPAGEEAQRLAVLPIRVLLDAFEIAPQKQPGRPTSSDRERHKLREQILDTLERWGVRDFRTLALLPEHALASRLGGTGTRLQRLARGAEPRTLALCEPSTHFEEALELESPVETLEPLSFLLNRLLDQLCSRLEARALAVQQLTLRLQLERRVSDEETTTLQELRGVHSSASISHIVGHNNQCQRSLRLPVAMRDTKVFLKLLQMELEAHPPGAPVVKIWITAEPAPPRSVQRGLFLPVTPEAEKLEITLSRIAGIVGKRRAGIARLLDTHRREGFRVDRFVCGQEEQSKTAHTATMWDSQEFPAIALRIFRPARRLRVQVNQGSPAALAAMPDEPDPNELQGKVLWAAGPWRSSGDWWTEQTKSERTHNEDEGQHWDREEWDVALGDRNGSGGVAVYRIYRDAGSGQWFADASYD